MTYDPSTLARRAVAKVRVERTEALPDTAQWADPIKWMERSFYLYDTKNLLSLFPQQADPLREALRRDASGRYQYSTVLWSWMKKSAKSTIIAAVCDYVAFHKPDASVILVANDSKQAFSRVGYYIRKNIQIGAEKGYAEDEYGQRLQEFRQQTRITSSGYMIEYPNGSRIQMVAVDPRGEAGGNDDLMVFSELWGWKHKSHQDMWAEMTISPNRFGFAQRWIDTYAGYRGESPILETLYDEICTPENQVTIGAQPECYIHGDQFATWVTVPTLPWQTDAYYDSERRTLRPSQFKRMHRNGWAESEESFVEIGWWDECADDTLPPLTRYDEIIISLDAGVKNDTFGMIAISRDPRLGSVHDDTYDGLQAPHGFIVRYSKGWQPPAGGKLRFSSADPQEVTPASELRRLIERYNVVQVTFDPWQLEHFAQQMEDETGAWFDAFGQIAEREVGDKMLYDMIKAGLIRHHGRHKTLRQHIANANAKVSGDDRKLRIVKRSEKLKVDLAVALAMAVKRGSEYIVR